MIAQEKTTKPEAEIAHATRHRRRKRRSFILDCASPSARRAKCGSRRLSR